MKRWRALSSASTYARAAFFDVPRSSAMWATRLSSEATRRTWNACGRWREDDVRAAADDDDVPHLGKAQDRLGRLLHRLPRRPVEAEELLDDEGDAGEVVLGRPGGEALGKGLVLEDLVDELRSTTAQGPRPFGWIFSR